MIEITAELTGFQQFLAEAAKIRNILPRVQALALNRTAEDILTEQRADVARNFTVRVPGFVLPPQKLPREWQANEKQRDEMRSIVGLGPVGDQMADRRRKILEPFETGKPKTIDKMPVAIPTKALRPSFKMLVAPADYPAKILGKFKQGQFQFLQSRKKIKASTRLKTVKGETQVIRSEGGAYFMMGKDGEKSWGIYKRVAPGRTGIRKLWNFRALVSRPKRLHFDAISERVFAERWSVNLLGFLDRFTEIAKGRG